MVDPQGRGGHGGRRPKVAGVVLGAGASRRLGRPKQLLPLDGKPVIRWTVERLRASRLDEIVVVVGHEADAVAAALAGLPARLVRNPDYRDGQSTSLRAGLAEVAERAEAVLFALADQPEVRAGAIDALIAAFERSDAAIVQPVYGGVPGNPVLFGRALFPELMRITGDQGARALIRAHAPEVLRVPVADGPPPGDIDTDDDYAALLERWRAAPGS